jgi:hypothetical protein
MQLGIGYNFSVDEGAQRLDNAVSETVARTSDIVAVVRLGARG